MTRDQLPQLTDEIAALWPGLKLTTESNIIFIGFRRRNGSFTPGMFTYCDLRTAIEACRTWAADHPGSLPTWNDGRGWKEIKYNVQQAVEAAQPSREEQLLQEHRDHYAGCHEPWPGDDTILAYIRSGRPTPLQSKGLTWVARLRQHMWDRFPDVDFDAERKKREWAQREASRDAIARDLRRDKPEPVKLRPTHENVVPGHKVPWSNGFQMTPKQIAEVYTEAKKKASEREHAHAK